MGVQYELQIRNIISDPILSFIHCLFFLYSCLFFFATYKIRPNKSFIMHNFLFQNIAHTLFISFQILSTNKNAKNTINVHNLLTCRLLCPPLHCKEKIVDFYLNLMKSAIINEIKYIFKSN